MNLDPDIFGYQTQNFTQITRNKRLRNTTICSAKGLSFGGKDYTKDLKTVECASFLGQTS